MFFPMCHKYGKQNDKQMEPNPGYTSLDRHLPTAKRVMPDDVRYGLCRLFHICCKCSVWICCLWWDQGANKSCQFCVFSGRCQLNSGVLAQVWLKDIRSAHHLMVSDSLAKACWRSPLQVRCRSCRWVEVTLEELDYVTWMGCRYDANPPATRTKTKKLESGGTRSDHRAVVTC